MYIYMCAIICRGKGQKVDDIPIYRVYQYYTCKSYKSYDDPPDHLHEVMQLLAKLCSHRRFETSNTRLRRVLFRGGGFFTLRFCFLA